MAVGGVLIRKVGTNAGVGQTNPVSAGYVLTDNGVGAIPTFQAPTGGGGSWIPLVDGSEPPVFITDGAGVLILVAGP